jgi:hypothetical protein
MPSSDVIETTVAEVIAKLLRQGAGADEPGVDRHRAGRGAASRTTKIAGGVVAPGLTDGDIDRLIKQAQKEVEPNQGNPPAFCAARRCRSRTAFA